LRVCPNFLVLELGSGAPVAPERNWLIQATADVEVDNALEPDNNLCGLVNTEQPGTNAVLDQVHVHNISEFRDESTADQGISLSAVVKKRAGDPTIALRCTRQNQTPGIFPELVDRVAPTLAKIVALEVGAVTGP
jgi:hypothetical protein